MKSSHQKPINLLPLIVGIFLVTLSHSVHAWGKEGHQIVANLAWKILSNSTKTSLIDIIASSSYGIDKDCTNDCSPLAQVADWADVARYSNAYHWTAPLHYIDIEQEPCPITSHLRKTKQCYFNYTRDCPNDACVAGAIVNDTTIVMDAAAASNSMDPADYLQRTSLMFLIHFVGDIHQPLHCSRTADKGGNDIHVDFHGDDITEDLARFQLQLRRPTLDAHTDSRRYLLANRHRKQGNLHSFWDSFMIEKSMHDHYNGSRVALEAYLWTTIARASKRQWASWLDCADGSNVTCTIQWGQESLEYALTYAYRNVNDTEIADGTTLSQEYYESRVKVVWKRLVVAGVRLASTLESAMSGKLVDSPWLATARQLYS